MIKQFLPLAAGAALFTLASAASAAQPAQLTDMQMDGVTAGGAAIGNAAGVAFGEALADTLSQTSTNVNTSGEITLPNGTVIPNFLTFIAVGQAANSSLAAGGFLFPAAAVSHSDTAATLP
jgi:hypothetical protein